MIILDAAHRADAERRGARRRHPRGRDAARGHPRGLRGSPRPRTAARRPVSAAAAPCSSTARPRSPAPCRPTRPPAAASSRSRASTSASAASSRAAFAAHRRRAVRLLHPRHRGARASHPQEDAAADARRDRAGPRRAPLPLHRLRQDRRRHRAGVARCSPARPSSPRRLVGQGRHVAAEVRSRGAGARRSQVHRRHDRARHAARRGGAVGAPARARPRASICRRRARCRACAPSSAPPTCRASASRGSSIPTGRSSSPSVRRRATPATSSSPSPPTRAHIARRAAELVAVDYEVLEPLTSTAAGARRRARRCCIPRTATPTTCCRRRRPSAATSTAALAQAAHVVTGTWSTQFIEHAFLEPESLPGGAARPHRRRWCSLRNSCTSTRRVRASTTISARSPARSALDGRRSCGDAGDLRRRLRRQGRSVDPGADGAAGAGDRPAGQADDRSRRVDPPAPQAPPDRDDLHRRLRRRRQADGGQGAHASATRAPTRRSAAR